MSPDSGAGADAGLNSPAASVATAPLTQHHPPVSSVFRMAAGQKINASAAA